MRKIASSLIGGPPRRAEPTKNREGPLAGGGGQRGAPWTLFPPTLPSHDGGEPLEPFRDETQRFRGRVGKGEGTHRTALRLKGNANNGLPASRGQGAGQW